VNDKNDLSQTGGVSLYSLDEDRAKKLWKWSEEVTGIKFESGAGTRKAHSEC
jgi:hypothetical protein